MFFSLPYPDIDPVLISIGPLLVRWYALAYITGITLGWWYLSRLLRQEALWHNTISKSHRKPPLSHENLDDIVFWATLGIILGGRLGYVLFYDPALLVAPWVQIVGFLYIPPALEVWQGGMSFHGGFLGVALAGWYFCRKHGLNALQIGDLFATVAPIGLFFGRIANFINAELYGRPSQIGWSMIFPTDPLQIPRHPSQLYEAFLEGIVLFVILRLATHRFGILRYPGMAIGIFIGGYGLARFFVEHFRQPDIGMPYLPLGLTMGMLLSLPMVGVGGWLLYAAYRRSSS